MEHETYMRKALELAQKAEGWTSPNPVVGALIVKDGKIIGEGYHKKAGTPHAEIHALSMAGTEAKGSTVYVTLEPCSHYGKTPPCADTLIKAEVAKVVIAMEDPNPKVAGRGINKLIDAGITVVTGILENEARILNEVFIKHITTRLPFVALKSAITLDGKTATKTGSSKWITGSVAREAAHRLRHRYDAILAGIGTIISDDSQLTTRIPGENLKSPIRVVIDSNLRIPEDAKILDTSVAPTLIYTCSPVSIKVERLQQKGVQVIQCPDDHGRVDLLEVLKDLYTRGFTSILVEGGAEINGTFLDKGLWDKLYVFLAPKLVGSHTAPGMFGGAGVSLMKDAITLKHMDIKSLGHDWLITAYPEGKEG